MPIFPNAQDAFRLFDFEPDERLTRGGHSQSSMSSSMRTTVRLTYLSDRLWLITADQSCAEFSASEGTLCQGAPGVFDDDVAALAGGCHPEPEVARKRGYLIRNGDFLGAVGREQSRIREILGPAARSRRFCAPPSQ